MPLRHNPPCLKKTNFTSALVFLSEVYEIKTCEEALAGKFGGEIRILALHSGVGQTVIRSLIRPSGGQRRIILSTNFAEVSCTIDGVDTVIDFAQEKERGRNGLTKVAVSKSSRLQRRDRVGRQKKGSCLLS